MLSWNRVGATKVMLALLIGGSTLVAGSASAFASGNLQAAHTGIPAIAPESAAGLAALVAGSSSIHSLPSGLVPRLEDVGTDVGNPTLEKSGCVAGETQSSVGECVFGDLQGRKTIVLYGDSHAEMWFDAFDKIALSIGWRFVILSKPYCPPTDLDFISPLANAPYSSCTAFHAFAVARIKKIHPAVVVITGALKGTAPGIAPATSLWQTGEEKTLSQLAAAGTKEFVLGSTPYLNTFPNCLAIHPSNIQECGLPLAKIPLQSIFQAERAAATASGATYISVLPWVCSAVCSPVIGKYEVYFDEYHLTATYVTLLTQVLRQALAPGLSSSPTEGSS